MEHVCQVDFLVGTQSITHMRLYTIYTRDKVKELQYFHSCHFQLFRAAILIRPQYIASELRSSHTKIIGHVIPHQCMLPVEIRMRHI